MKTNAMIDVANKVRNILLAWVSPYGNLRIK